MSIPKIPEAFSTECCEIMDAEMAFELYWAGDIKDKHNFQCKNENCFAQITCANIDKERVQMKKRPYFRLVGKHTCEPDAEIDAVNIISSEENADSRSTIDNKKDILLSSAEREEKDKRIKLTPTENTDYYDWSRKKRSGNSNNSMRNAEYKTIAPIVSKYLNFEEQNILDEMKISYKGIDITYKNFFVDLNNYHCDYFIKDSRIYFGNAKVEKSPTNEKEYILKFRDNVEFRGLKRQPSIYISTNLLDNKSGRINWRSKLEFYCDSNIEIVIFIFGNMKLRETKYYEKDTETLKSKYYSINLSLSEFDLRYCDIREF